VLKKKPINNVDKPAAVNMVIILSPFTIPQRAVTKIANETGAIR
jgi:hypothetical protein